MNYYQIYENNEGKYLAINDQKFKEFIVNFNKQTKIIKSDILDDFTSQYVELYYRIRSFVLTKYPEYITLFYQMLNQAGFNLEDEIFLTMRIIGRELETNISKDWQEYLLLSPYIDNIMSQNGKFIINSKEFGDYAFYPACNYLQDPEIRNLLLCYLGSNYCHQSSWELIKQLNNANLVTLLMPYYFVGNYYHSVVRDVNGFYIDLVNGCVYDEMMGEKLFSQNIVSEIRKEDLELRLDKAQQEESAESKNADLPPALVLALHNQSQK